MAVGGGFTGLAITLQSLFNSFGGPPLNLLLTLVFVGLYALVVVSGLLFAHDSTRTGPLLAALAIQVPSISSSSFVYQFAAGLAGIISISSPEKENTAGAHYGWELFLGGSWRVSFGHGNPLGVGVNVVPLTLLLLLWKAAQTSSGETWPSRNSFGRYSSTYSSGSPYVTRVGNKN